LCSLVIVERVAARKEQPLLLPPLQLLQPHRLINITPSFGHVRFTSECGHASAQSACPLYANRVPMHRNKGHLKEGALDHLALLLGKNFIQ
jgi:hypothetical protein